MRLAFFHVSVIVVCALTLASFSIAAPQPLVLTENLKLTPLDAAVADEFGFRVSVSGNLAVVGARNDDDNGDRSGAAYVVNLSTGAPFLKLLADDGAALDEFGFAVSIDGNRILISAPFDDDNGDASGSAYIFDATTGIQIAKLLPLDGAPENSFGESVSIDGNVALVGARLDDEGGNNSGAAYVFKDDGLGNWTQVAKLKASDAAPNDLFGYAVSVCGDTALVGAPLDDDGADAAGSAYIFRDNGAGVWIEIDKLIPLVPTGDAWFGNSVSLDGDTALVGAFFDDVAGVDSGAAYVFREDSLGDWAQTFRLAAPSPAPGDWFGHDVSVDGGAAVVSASHRDMTDTDAGMAYVFDTTTGFQLAQVGASDGAANDWFGEGLALDGVTLIVGTRFHDDPFAESGAAYVFENILSGGWSLANELTASDGASFDQFGAAVALSGDIGVVGAFNHGDNGEGSGAAYSYNVITGMEFAELLPLDGGPFEQFGISVSVSGTTAIIGASEDSDNGPGAGSAYLFNAMTGQQLFKLLPVDGLSFDSFGASVSISDGIAVIGASGHDENGLSAGTAYLVNAVNGQFMTELAPTDPASSDFFGFSVGIDGDTVVVGAMGDDDLGNSSGSAYLFSAMTGQQLMKLLPDDGGAFESFGRHVAIGESFVAVVSTGDFQENQSVGSAYVFDRQTGMQLHKLVPIDGAAGDVFGTSVAVRGGDVVVGAYNADFSAAYVFDASTGQQTAKIIPVLASVNPDLGTAVAVDGARALVGLQPNGGDNAGRAYLFEIEMPTCIGDLTGDAIVNGADLAALLSVWGDPIANPAADLNSDGLINGADLAQLLANWTLIP